MSSELIHIESGLTCWLAISFFITTIIPMFFISKINESEIKYKEINILFLLLIFCSCIIIIFSVIPFYYRHKSVMKTIKDRDVKERENVIFILQMSFCLFYFIFNIFVLRFLLKYFV